MAYEVEFARSVRAHLRADDDVIDVEPVELDIMEDGVALGHCREGTPVCESGRRPAINALLVPDCRRRPRGAPDVCHNVSSAMPAAHNGWEAARGSCGGRGIRDAATV